MAARHGASGVADETTRQTTRQTTRPTRPPELSSWRAGGAQIIPRPASWALGPPAPWPPLPTTHRFRTESVLTAVAERGAGKPPPWHVDEPLPSAVLICLYDGPAGAEVLLTRRSWHMRTHRGEVSFPGGRLDPGETPVEAALREAHEEVALDPRQVEVIGELDHLATMVSRSVIVPIVARL